VWGRKRRQKECKNDEQAEGRDSNAEGDEASLHNNAWHDKSSMMMNFQKSLPQEMQRGMFWVAMMKMMRTK
jgi:hypothetical protein